MKPKGRLTWFTLPETNSKMAPENWSKIGTSLEKLGPKHEYSAVQNSHHRTFSRSNSCQSGDTHQMKVPLLGVFVSSLQIRWATKNTLWPGSLIGILISWHITIPTYIGEFFIPNLYPKQPVFLRWYEKSAYVVMFLASLGTPTNSGSTCEANNTQEESLPKVLLLMLGGGGSSALWSKTMCSSGWSKVLLLSGHLHHFSEHSTGKQSGTIGTNQTHLCRPPRLIWDLHDVKLGDNSFKVWMWCSHWKCWPRIFINPMVV